MASVYHAGEMAVQARVGVQTAAEQLGKGISTIIQPAAQTFLQHQQLAIVSTVDSKGQVWASLLTGPPGFLQAVTDHTLRIKQ